MSNNSKWRVWMESNWAKFTRTENLKWILWNSLFLMYGN